MNLDICRKCLTAYFERGGRKDWIIVKMIDRVENKQGGYIVSCQVNDYCLGARRVFGCKYCSCELEHLVLGKDKENESEEL